MDSIHELNVFLKKSRLDLLQFNIETTFNNETQTNEYKANIVLNVQNHTSLDWRSSDWCSDIEIAKNQCAKKTLIYFQNQPSADINVPRERKPIIKKDTFLLISVVVNIVYIMTYHPRTGYIFFPLLVLVFWLFTVPFFYKKDKRILLCTGNRVVARSSKSYDEYTIPIKYLYTTDYMIEENRGLDETVHIQDSFLATATQDILLPIVPNHDSDNEDPNYRVVKGIGFRVRVLNGKNTAVVRIIKESGKLLTYYSLDIGNSFCQQDFPIIKVRSHHGIHFVATRYGKPLDLGLFEKYQIISLIYLKWVISFFHY